MVHIVEGNLRGEGVRLGVVASRFNDFVTKRLVEGALASARRHGVLDDAMTVVWVPGAWELPAAAHKLAATGRVDAIACIGALIRGATPHFDAIARAIGPALQHVALASDIPVTFGVLTCDTVEQALERAGIKAGNKGAEAAIAAIEMARVFEALRPKGSPPVPA